MPSRIGSATRVEELFVIERGMPRLAELDRDETLRRMLANTDDAYGFPPFKYFAPAVTIGGRGYRELRAREEEILRGFLSHVRARVLASDSFGWADAIPELLRRERGSADAVGVRPAVVTLPDDAGRGGDATFAGRTAWRLAALARGARSRPAPRPDPPRRPTAITSPTRTEPPRCSPRSSCPLRRGDAAAVRLAVTTLAWMLDSWRTPWAVGQMPFPARQPRLSFSLSCRPGTRRRCSADTVDRLLEQDHPRLRGPARRRRRRPRDHGRGRALAERRLRASGSSSTHSVPKNKPKALNRALPHCTGQIVGVFDAEDEVALELLQHVDAVLPRHRAHVVQGGVQLMNYRSSWWSLRNTLEYFFWFASRLHFHARNGFIPLGGNTVFVRDRPAPAGRRLGRRAAWPRTASSASGCRSAGARVAVAYTPGPGDPRGDARRR